MVSNVQQMDCKIRIERGQFFDAATLKTLVVGQSADVHGDILAKLFCQMTARITAIIGSQELPMLVRRISTPFDVQRILESNLLIRALPIVLGNRLLKRLEVEEIKRIAKTGKELTDTIDIDMLRLVQRTFHLHLLLVAQSLFAYIFK